MAGVRLLYPMTAATVHREALREEWTDKFDIPAAIDIDQGVTTHVDPLILPSGVQSRKYDIID
jgi:hypothetical protein